MLRGSVECASAALEAGQSDPTSGRGCNRSRSASETAARLVLPAEIRQHLTPPGGPRTRGLYRARARHRSLVDEL